MALLKLALKNNGEANDITAAMYIEKLVNSARENKDVSAAKKILEEIELLSSELMWKTRMPATIRWYNRNFETIEWEDKEHARTIVNKALKLLGTPYTKIDLEKALNKIYDARKYTDEITEAEGLLG